MKTAAKRTLSAQFDVFISHASEDKAAFVDPLACELTRLGLKVWYDKTALTLGDSLRGKIDEGLACSDYGVVILSHSFFAKQWPPAELGGLFAREVRGRKVILPVRHGLTTADLLGYSPMLADKLAALTEDGVAVVAKQILEVVKPPQPPSTRRDSNERRPKAAAQSTTLPPKDNVTLANSPAIQLIGRASEIEKLDRLLTEDSNTTIIITGPSGVGKTALAKEIVRRQTRSKQQRFHDIVFMTAKRPWCAHEAHPPDNVTSTMGLYRLLLQKLDLDSFVFAPVQVQLERLLEELKQTPLLIVLDGFEAFNIDPSFWGFLKSLPEQTRTLVTTTGEDPPHPSIPFASFPLRPLLPEDSVRLAKYVRLKMGIPNNKKHDRDVARASGGLPIVIRWLVAFSDPTKASVARDTRSGGNGTRLHPSTRLHAPLTADSNTVLRALCLLVAPATVRTLSEVCHLPQEAISNALVELGRMLIAIEPTPGVYSIHELARKCLYPNDPRASQSSDPLLQSALTWAEIKVSENNRWEFDNQQFCLLSEELPNLRAIVAAADQAGYSTRAEALAVSLAHIMHISGEWNQAVEVLQKLWTRSRTDQTRIQAGILLGRHYAHRQELVKAIKILREAEAIARGATFAPMRAEALMRQGHAFVNAGQLSKAFPLLRLSISLAKKVDAENTIISAVGYLADAYNQLGHYDRTIHLLESKLPQTEGAWSLAASYYYALLASAYLALGFLKKAHTNYSTALDRARIWKDERLKAWASFGLAQITWDEQAARQAHFLFNKNGMAREATETRRFLNRTESFRAEAPRVILVGAPAAGKTRLRLHIAKTLNARFANVYTSSLDDVHREFAQKSPDAAGYVFTPGKSLILKKPSVQIPKAMAKLRRDCRGASRQEGFLIEIAHENLFGAIRSLGKSILCDTLIIQLLAPVDIRLKRNALRDPFKTPDRIVKEYQESLSEEEIASLVRWNARVETLHTDRASQAIEHEVLALITRYYGDSSKI